MSITEQALAAVKARQAERGTGVGVAIRWADIFHALTGHQVIPEDYAWAGLAMKLAREGEHPRKNPDNLVDTVGYVEVLDRIRNAPPEQNNGIVCSFDENATLPLPPPHSRGSTNDK